MNSSSPHTFPSWAPQQLIIDLDRLRKSANSYRELYVEEKSEALNEEINQCTECGANKWNIAADETEKLAFILHNLLTHPDMENVWKAINRPITDPKPWKTDPEYLLWSVISDSIKKFPHLPTLKITPAQRTKNFKSVAKIATKLQEAIESNSEIESFSNKLMANYLAVQNLNSRIDYGEKPSWGEFQMPLTLSVDREDFRRRHLEIDFNDEKIINWNKRTLISRLEYWAAEAEKTRLTDLLTFFVSYLEKSADDHQEISQPGRGNAAFKSYLIRRLSDHMSWLYGQPLHDAVAIIVSVVLDLQTPLTRDDIRPYLKNRGKKFIDNN